jgi:glycosyltransferase involved in cell wall biosynthesis
MQAVGEGAPRLVLVGDGPDRRELEAIVAREGISEFVHFVGQRPYDEVPVWMGAADWLVLSSHYEGWPTVYFEAMACGRPVLTSNVASATDAICDAAYGMVIEPNTPEAWARTLTAAKSKAFDAKVIRAYAEQHSWDNWAKSCVAIMEQVFQEPRRNRTAADSAEIVE